MTSSPGCGEPLSRTDCCPPTTDGLLLSSTYPSQSSCHSAPLYFTFQTFDRRDEQTLTTQPNGNTGVGCGGLGVVLVDFLSSKLISVDFNVYTEAVNRLCIHCNGFPKYGCVGVYCPGLGLCRESAVGNKTIAMNCLRIMLGINSPCTAQSAKQSNPIKIHSVQSPVQDFVLQLPLIEYAPYLRVVSWIISISGILVGPVWVSWSDVCEWRAENYLLSLPGNVTPTPSVRQPPTILNTW